MKNTKKAPNIITDIICCSKIDFFISKLLFNGLTLLTSLLFLLKGAQMSSVVRTTASDNKSQNEKQFSDWICEKIKGGNFPVFILDDFYLKVVLCK